MLHIPQEAVTNIRCASYDFSISDWTTDGCDTTVEGGVITCTCDHLTNFGALVVSSFLLHSLPLLVAGVQVTALFSHTGQDVCSRTGDCELSDEEELTLEVISIIGVVLSLVGIVLTIITLLIFK